MSSIQAYKAHKQEGTIAATTLVSKVHKQGASSNSQGFQHNNHRLAKNIKKKELGTAQHITMMHLPRLFNNRNATPINLKGNVLSTHASTLTTFYIS